MDNLRYQYDKLIFIFILIGWGIIIIAPLYTLQVPSYSDLITRSLLFPVLLQSVMAFRIRKYNVSRHNKIKLLCKLGGVLLILATINAFIIGVLWSSI